MRVRVVPIGLLPRTTYTQRGPSTMLTTGSGGGEGEGPGGEGEGEGPGGEGEGEGPGGEGEDSLHWIHRYN